MSSKLLQVAGNLLLSACSPSYIGKFFSKPVRGKTSYIWDKTGRICIYHGVNVSNFSKSAPDFLPWQTKDDFARLKTWGFNLVRYLVFWEAIEPTKGTYSIPYIQATLERLKWLQELGIDVIIDIHQDVFARRFTGNGFPDWAVHDGGNKFVCQSPWNMNYFQPAVVSSYDYFWQHEDLKTDYFNMFRFVMPQFDKLDNVIGFDVMNEPFISTIPSFEKKILTDFYERLQALMMASGFKSKMCFEPEMYTSAGIPSNLRFVPNKLAGLGNVYYPHYYDAFCHEGVAYEPLNKTIMTRALNIKQAEAQKFGVPLMIGEFGISASVKGYEQYLRDFVHMSNEGLFGWTVYTYDKNPSSDVFGVINDDGSPSGQLKAILSVYPQKIAGRNPIIKIIGNNFNLYYDTDPLITGPTEIFIPEGLQYLVVRANDKNVPCQSGLFLYHNNEDKKQHIFISWA